jgi:uncharacterized protein
MLRATAGLGLTGIGGTAYITVVEPEAVEVTRLTVPLRNLPAEFDGFTLVQISDWHLGEWMTLQRMTAIARQVNELQPDTIVMTGDFLSRIQANTFDEITKSLDGLTAPDGIFAILGNHDYWTDGQRTRRAVEAVGKVQLLLNANVSFQRSNSALYLAGVDDIWEQHHDLNMALDGIPSDSPVILLAHEPDYADDVAKTGRVSLQLSGHSHGGQVRLPFKGALILPYLGQKYDMGLYNISGMALYTNRGLGMIAPYVRFGCRPEITHITLRTANP